MRAQTFHIGTSSWKWDVWKGVFYPQRGDELAAYSRVFETVEIDSTWYFAPAPRVVLSWAQRVPENFRFAAKVPREITHERQLVNCAEALAGFLEVMSLLGDKRGPLLLQFPPTWSFAEGIGALQDFLPLLRDGTDAGWRFAAEFRHRSWCRDSVAVLLQQYGVAWTLYDTGFWWDAESRPPLYVTADWTYIRWRGDQNEKFGPFSHLQHDRTTAEANWLHALRELPVSEIWGYFSNQWAGFAPGSAHGFRQLLGQPVPPLDTPVTRPAAAAGGQGTLFDL